MPLEASSALADVVSRVTYAVADARFLPFPLAYFDAVIANHMVYHVGDKPALFAEVRRVLRPGGKFFAATNGAGGDEVGGLLRRVDPAMQAAALAEAATAMPTTHPQTFTLDNGEAQLAPWFALVSVHRFAGITAVTEVEPVVAYVLSRPFYGQRLAGKKLETFRRLLAEEIASKAALRITRSTGIFEASRDGRRE